MSAQLCMKIEPQDATACLLDQQDRVLSEKFSRAFDLADCADDERDEVTGFIRQCFAEVHDAHIEHFMPRLLSLRDKQGRLIAAFGLRSAAQSQLFLEHYLDAPIENILAARFGQSVRRDEVIEVGNLSAVHAGATRWLIVAVTMLLHREGYRWIAFTGTNVVRNGLHRLGLRPHEIASAHLHRLPEEDRGQWGNYYEQSPTVMTGEIPRGYRSLLADEKLLRVLDGRRDSRPEGSLS
jgi:hypothetical protein